MRPATGQRYGYGLYSARYGNIYTSAQLLQLAEDAFAGDVIGIPNHGVLRVGDLVVDTNRRQVTRDGQRIALTYTEFSLLELLFREPGCVVPRAEILEQLWGYPPRRAADLRVVDVYVARLRGKLEPDPRNPELILTVRGTGYASQRVGEMSLAAGA